MEGHRPSPCHYRGVNDVDTEIVKVELERVTIVLQDQELYLFLYNSQGDERSQDASHQNRKR